MAELEAVGALTEGMGFFSTLISSGRELKVDATMVEAVIRAEVAATTKVDVAIDMAVAGVPGTAT